MFDLPPTTADIDKDVIVVTASLNGSEAAETSDAVSLIDAETVERLDESRAVPLLRLLPSVSISETGPAGAQAQLRIRGAEANHTLLFIDGIKANDPAAGNEARFELLGMALGDSVELLRGPQSALWGSEALGGVVALRSERGDGDRLGISAEGGSHGFARADLAADIGTSAKGLSFAIGGQSSKGIDSFGSQGERDGYDNLAARLSARLPLGRAFALAASGFAIDANSDFDGFDPDTFLRADTRDNSAYGLAAGQVTLTADSDGWAGKIWSGLLGSRNINYDGNAEINRTSGERWTAGGQIGRSFGTGRFTHQLTVRVDYEDEDFHARDIAYGGFTDQHVSRDRTGFTAEWRGTMRGGISLDAAIRHDRFSDFADATSFSAGALVPVAKGWSIAANYGEGIAAPTFYDLYGFFPGSFIGNPDLKPESARGFDIGLRYASSKASAALTLFDQRLKDEIVDIFDFDTFTSTTANGDGKSKRRGVEAEAAYIVSPALRLSANYSYLDTEGPKLDEGRLRETRRPKHRGAIIADGETGRLQYGASIALVGARFDDDFDLFPAARVKLKSYAILSARIAYEIEEGVALTLRGSNLLGDDYQDVVGYQTEGRTIYAGLSIRR